MNHQTERILNEAKHMVSDKGVFTDDQIMLLHNMIDRIGAAIAKEAQLAKTGPCSN